MFILILSMMIITSEHTRIPTLSIEYQIAQGQPSQEAPQVYDPEIKIASPEYGAYNSANTNFGGTEDEVSVQSILDYQKLIDKKIVWAYFSNNWIDEIRFPEESVKIIDNLEIVPFIRMMPRTTFVEGIADPVFTLQSIIDGKFDKELTQWALDAKRTNIPLMVEFGTEANGDWFPWSGILNGGDETDNYGDPEVPDGPERFRDAYKHIIDLFNNQDVNNITWVFHMVPPEDAGNIDPSETWNSIKNYYPGDDYIDWIGTSIYGSIKPGEEWKSFTDVLNNIYTELSSLSSDKPIAILELGVINDPQSGDKSEWIQSALQTIESESYPRIKAISYWNEKWEDSDVIDLTVNSSREVADTFRNIISSSFFLTDAQYQFDGENQSNYVDALAGKGYALDNSGNYSGAVEYFDHALDIEPNNVDALAGKGYALDNSGNYSGAVEYFDHALDIEPNNVDALAGKGYALDNSGNYSGAVEYFDHALDIEPNNVDALIWKR
ncbi:tetratricopeptide repeat protein [Candidatus Nitrosocosmicus sp. R]